MNNHNMSTISGQCEAMRKHYAENCGTGAGGFQSENTCGQSGSSSSSETDSAKARIAHSKSLQEKIKPFFRPFPSGSPYYRSITQSEIDQLREAGYAVTVYPKKGLVSVNGLRRYKLSK